MLILVAAILAAIVVRLFGWVFEDIAHATERFCDKAQKFLDEVPTND